MDVEKTVRAKMTERQRRHHYYLVDVMNRLEYDLHSTFFSDEAIPPKWQTIAEKPATPRKRRVTMWVGEDVVKFFKSMGTGYQTRMNDVLSSFMHARISGLVEDGARYRDYVNDRAYGARPDVGTMELELEVRRLKRELRELEKTEQREERD